MIVKIGVIVVAVKQHGLDPCADGTLDIRFELIPDHQRGFRWRIIRSAQSFCKDAAVRLLAPDFAAGDREIDTI